MVGLHLPPFLRATFDIFTPPLSVVFFRACVPAVVWGIVSMWFRGGSWCQRQLASARLRLLAGGVRGVGRGSREVLEARNEAYAEGRVGCCGHILKTWQPLAMVAGWAVSMRWVLLIVIRRLKVRVRVW
jgi:hypothetical protein